MAIDGNISVAAVVVTFNRKVLLCECLDALLAQNVAVDRIVLIDNASSDGTEDCLRRKDTSKTNSLTTCGCRSTVEGQEAFTKA